MGVAEDRISNLSDAVLVHILSSLPTKLVVSTCILSKRWSLKILQLNRIKSVHEDLIERFVSNSPVLEELSLKKCSRIGWKPTICISAPALKCLTISGYGRDDEQNNCKIKIHAPNLLSLAYIDVLFKDHVIPHNFSSLTEANIDFDSLQSTNKKRSNAYKLLEGISNVKLLKLSNATLEVLTFDNEPVPNLPTFYNLIHLEVTSMFYCSRLLMNILLVAPNLESLVFAEGFFQFLSTKDPVWAKRLVPECVLLNLKVVEFRQFYGGTREVQAIKYFLKNARVLEKMTILSSSTLPTTEKNKVMKKIVKFPRGSTSCEVNIL